MLEADDAQTGEEIQNLLPTSPMPRPRIVMDFFAALRAVVVGKRVTKLEWADRDAFGLLNGGVLMLHKGGEPEDVFHAWIINDGDLMGSDWIVLP